MDNSKEILNHNIHKINVAYYEAFSNVQGKGNPAGVVFNGDFLTEDQMQTIAKNVGFNETAFLLESDKADVRIRYFTPGHEMNLCGHGTIASIYGLMKQLNATSSKSITIETLAGILNVQYNNDHQEVIMEQSPAKFIEYNGELEPLTDAIGLHIEDVDSRYPIVYGNTGIWTLILPIKKLETFLKMKPDNKRFQEILSKIPTASVHPICLETYNKTCKLHGRHFSSARSGTIEDPVTGTASGVMGAYYATYIHPLEQTELLVEQGNEIGRKGIVRVLVKKQNGQTNVKISGEAVFIQEMVVKY